MKLTLSTLIALLLPVAAIAGNPNPTESQDAYWDLKDQAAAWREHRAEQARAAERETQQKPATAAPVAERPTKG